MREIVSHTVQPIITLIVAKLLTSENFGVVGVAMIATGFAQIFQDFGLGKTHEEERMRIAYNGWLRTQKDYTWLKQMTNVFDTIDNIEKYTPFHQVKRGKMIMPKTFLSRSHLAWSKAFYLEGDREKAMDEALMAIKYSPFNLEAWVVLSMVIFPRAIFGFLKAVYGSFFKEI